MTMSDLPPAAPGASTPRDILADRISTWIEDDYKVYDFADRLIMDLFKAGFEIVPREVSE